MNDIASLLHGAQTIAILSHVDPDGDTLGSALALASALESACKHCFVVCPSIIPRTYVSMRGVERVGRWGGLASWARRPDLIIGVDANTLSRFTESDTGAQPRPTIVDGYLHWEPLGAEGVPVLIIDHHVASEPLGLANRVETESASTAELVYDLLIELGLPLTGDTMENLMVGIVTDTHGFQYSNTTARTLRTAASLLERGADLPEIARWAFRIKTFAATQLWGHALLTARQSANGRIILSHATQAMITGTGAAMDETEGMANYMLDIEGVEVSAFLREQGNGKFKASIRSLAPHDVTSVATHFGGGGHARAAGCTLDGDMEAALDAMRERLELLLEATP